MDSGSALQLNRLLEHARHDSEVLAVLQFGSRARGDAGRESDLDVCLVLFAKHPADRSSNARKRLEYLTHFDLDVSIFQDLPIYIRRRVLKEGRVLFVRDEDLLYDVAYRTAQAFEDFRHIYDAYLNQVADAGP
jgi:predicted nucleotidyltransferase